MLTNHAHYTGDWDLYVTNNNNNENILEVTCMINSLILKNIFENAWLQSKFLIFIPFKNFPLYSSTAMPVILKSWLGFGLGYGRAFVTKL